MLSLKRQDGWDGVLFNTGKAPSELSRLPDHRPCLLLVQALRQAPCCEVWATFMPRVYTVKPQPDVVLAEFKYCKACVQRSSVTTDSLFSSSWLRYCHLISAGSEQKAHFLWYRDASVESLTNWDCSKEHKIQMEGVLCCRVRHKLPSALLSVKKSSFRRSSAPASAFSFHILCQSSEAKVNKRGGFWCRHPYPQTRVTRSWQQIVLSSKLDKTK